MTLYKRKADATISKDSLTGLLTPEAEDKLIGNKAVGEIYVDMNDMHSANVKLGDSVIDQELINLGNFLKSTFYLPIICIVRTTGDNFRVSSETLDDKELLSILHKAKGLYKGKVGIRYGAGFVNELSEEMFKYAVNKPFNYSPKPERIGGSLGVIDIRHLLPLTEDLGICGVEHEIFKLEEFMKREITDSIVLRPQADEIWINSFANKEELAEKINRTIEDYSGTFTLDFGIGANEIEAHADLHGKKNKKVELTPRKKKGDFKLL